MNRPASASRSRLWTIPRGVVWPAVILVGVALMAQLGTFLDTLDMSVYDHVLRWQASRQPAVESRYVLVEIDDRSIEVMGRFPWSRSTFAELFDRMKEGDAAVVGVDVLFAEPADPEGDAEMARAMKEAGNVVLASVPVLSRSEGAESPAEVGRLRRAERLIEPIPHFAESAAAVGSISILEDRDGSMRRYSFVVRVGDQPYPSLAQAMVGLASGGEGAFEVRGDGTMLINYGNLSPGAITRVSFSDVLGMRPDALRRLFDRKIVMVAATYAGGVDVGPTPLATRTPSSFAHIYAVNTLLSGGRLRAVPGWLPYSLAVAILLFLASQVPQRHPLQLLAIAIIVMAAILVVIGALFLAKGVFVGPALPILTSAVFVSGYGLEQWWVANRNLRIRNRELEETLENLRRTRAAKARMEAELDVAREIQFSMLPREFPSIPDEREFDLHATLVPAREVGGDFYDFFMIDPDHLCFCVADVSGKGVSAALFMAVAKALMKSNAANELSPAAILSRTNDQLATDNQASMFVTVWLAILDLASGELRYANGGHNPPYLRRVDGELARLDRRHGPAVAAMEGVPFGEDQLTLRPGETILLYTDGVSEAKNQDGELYGESRLVESLGSIPFDSAAGTVNATVARVWKYQGAAEQADDVTILALHFLGRQRADE